MENEDKDVLVREYLGVPEKLTSRLMRDRFGQFVCEKRNTLVSTCYQMIFVCSLDEFCVLHHLP